MTSNCQSLFVSILTYSELFISPLNCQKDDIMTTQLSESIDLLNKWELMAIYLFTSFKNKDNIYAILILYSLKTSFENFIMI